MKYHKNILLSSKYLLQSLKSNFQKNQYLNSRFSIPKKSIRLHNFFLPIIFIKPNFLLFYSFIFSKNR